MNAGGYKKEVRPSYIDGDSTTWDLLAGGELYSEPGIFKFNIDALLLLFTLHKPQCHIQYTQQHIVLWVRP